MSSQVTEEVMEEVKAWQSRPLEPVYPILYLDALFVKMRHEGRVENRAVYVAIGVTLEGRKEVLGLWTSTNEGARLVSQRGKRSQTAEPGTAQCVGEVGDGTALAPDT